jgi:putative two-component system response regulator
MALADVYAAMTSRRVYKPPIPHSVAVEAINGSRGTHFDPFMVDCFLGKH